MASRAHNFKIYSFSKPTWCHYCGEFIWGLAKQGYKCKECGYCCHKGSCRRSVPNNCGEALREIHGKKGKASKGELSADTSTNVDTASSLEDFSEVDTVSEESRRGKFFSSHRATAAQQKEDSKLKFLRILLQENLEELTEGMIHSVTDQVLYNFFPLITSCIQQLGSTRCSQETYKKVLSAFLCRVNANRCLKTKLLLLSQTEEYQHYWELKLLHRVDCYERAVLALHQKQKEIGVRAGDILEDDEEDEEDEEEVDDDQEGREGSLNFEKSGNSKKLTANKLHELETEESLSVLAKKMFDPNSGVPIKDRKQGAKVYKNSFFGREAVDWMMANLEILTRSDAVVIGDRMLRYGIISHRSANKKKPFLDGVHYYTYVQHNVGHEVVGTASSTKLGASVAGGLSLKSSKVQLGEGVGKVVAGVPVDTIDLQTLHFLSRTVNDVNLIAGEQLGFVQLAHPLRVDWESNESIVSKVKVEKIFTSLAQPAMLSLSHLPEDVPISDDSFLEVTPRIIVKKGDNLYQDLCCEVLFGLFNAIWQSSPEIFPDPENVPWIFTYEVFPTGNQEGFMEVVANVLPFKDFDWKNWQTEIKDEADINNMINSAAGAYVGGYIVGVRDRHWDNILIKDGRTLFQIDFGFLLGTQPPIDAPRFSISQQMKDVLISMNKWEFFVQQCLNAFKALRARANEVVRACMRVFGQAGWDPAKVKAYIISKDALMMDTNDNGALAAIRKLIESSASSWQNLFKQFSHKKIDPLWYSLLKSHFGPAEFVMKKVEEKDAKKQAKQKGGAKKSFGSSIHTIEA